MASLLLLKQYDDPINDPIHYTRRHAIDDDGPRNCIINYLSAINKNVGLLVNFGESSLKWQRISNFKVKDVSPEQIRVE